MIKLPSWLSWLGALIASLGSAMLYGRHKGKQSVKDEVEKESAKMEAIHNVEKAKKPTTADELIDRIDKL